MARKAMVKLCTPINESEPNRPSEPTRTALNQLPPSRSTVTATLPEIGCPVVASMILPVMRPSELLTVPQAANESLPPEPVPPPPPPPPLPPDPPPLLPGGVEATGFVIGLPEPPQPLMINISINNINKAGRTHVWVLGEMRRRQDIRC